MSKSERPPWPDPKQGGLVGHALFIGLDYNPKRYRPKGRTGKAPRLGKKFIQWRRENGI